MRLTLLTIFLALVFSSFGQEQLLELQSNPVIQHQLRSGNTLRPVASYYDTVPISLPFFDDFSKNSVFPSAERWYDHFGFENTDWPVNPVNLGVVTMDAINDSGSMYPNAVPGPLTFIADQLTSRYIRLDSILSPVPKKLSPADSVYFSFYYQPQGRGSAPKSADSLVLQFLVRPAHDSISPTDTVHIPDIWEHVWSTRGMPLDTFFLQYNRYFKQVSIPVRDTVFFSKKFQFRFFNFVSLASNSEPSWQSNCCQWNIDNVYLNSGRSIADTIYPEIRFIEPPPSMLKSYVSMPYPQYCDNPTEEMIDTVSVTFRNWDTINHVVNYKYDVRFPNGTAITTYEQEEDSLVRPYYKYNEMTLYPPVTFIYPIASTDSAEFLLSHYIKDVQPGSSFRDTIISTQKMYNYYAYDDGTPEKGYGLTKAGSLMAYRFRLNKSPDTLRGVSIYFNKTLGSNNQQFFYLTVWNDNNGKPGDTIYSRLAYVSFTDSLNKFFTYHLEVPVRISGTFYVGTITTTDDNLNIGFDRYTNSQNNLLYNSTGEWYTSAFSGSLLFRPLVGKPIPLGIPASHRGSQRLIAYPNPCTGPQVSIMSEDPSRKVFNNGNALLTLRNLYGQAILSGPYSPSLDVSNIAPGMYILEVTDRENGTRFTGKLIISR